ncbi:GIP [Symbiodinium natans]|uniref:GIP protein n=1 Tax=Symbiodinium natans TaxID=878477 RepID=A0A812M2G4_9DINO|nr:GIP [Symbiodinium natans]
MASFYGHGVWHDGGSGDAAGMADESRDKPGEPKPSVSGSRDERPFEGSEGETGDKDQWKSSDWWQSLWDAGWDRDGWQGWGGRSSWTDTWTSVSSGASDGDRDRGPRDGVPLRDDGDTFSDGHRDSSKGEVAGGEGGRGPSERIMVFSLPGEGDGDELGTLDMERLGSTKGMEYYTQWVRDRYLDVQVTQVGRSLSEFFRRLRRKPGQSIRDDCGEYDRCYARLMECGCVLPDIACAWVFIDRLGLDEAAELNLLASVGNVYDLKMLQRAAIVQDRALRKPWEQGNPQHQKGHRGAPWWKKNQFVTQTANVADVEIEEAEAMSENGETIPQEIAEEWFEAFMTHETAKQKYRDAAKMRGSDPEAVKRLASERLQIGEELLCGENFMCSVVCVTWDLKKEGRAPLLAITDTAKTVAGAPWVETYLAAAKDVNFTPLVLDSKEAFKFGASRIFESAYSIVISFGLGSQVVQVKVAVVNGDVPLLLSRKVLGQLGMVLDVASNRADFRATGVQGLALHLTETGHPAIAVQPEQKPAGSNPGPWQDIELQLFPKCAQYTAFVAESMSVEGDRELLCGDNHVRERVGSASVGLEAPQNPKLFFPKKIGLATHNMLLDDSLTPSSFMSWWENTKISNDFWVEGEHSLVRVHVVPRKHFFDPEGWSTGSEVHKHALLEQLGQCLLERPKQLWELTKAELYEEAESRGLWVNPSWSAPEVRSLIREDIDRASSVTPATMIPPGLSKMTLEMLIQTVTEMNIEIPPRASKGMVMRLIRDGAGGGDQHVMTFGRYKGYLFTETPPGYRQWAMREVQENSNASEELRMYAEWCRARPEGNSKGTYFHLSEDDPEANATTPYVFDEVDNTRWELLGRTGTSTIQHPSTVSPKPKAYPRTPTTLGTRRGAPWETGSSSSMQAELDPDVLEEIQQLETRLAVIRDRHGGLNGPEEQATGVDDDPCPGATIVTEFEPTEEVFYECFEETDGCVEQDGGKEILSVETMKDAEQCEALAKQKLKEKKFEIVDLLEIVENINFSRKGRHRRAYGDKDAVINGILGGLWSYGSMSGISNVSMSLPCTMKYINVFMRNKLGNDATWTSFALNRDIATDVHCDHNNLPGSISYTMSFGNFSGGELWCHDEETTPELCVLRHGPAGEALRGRLVVTKDVPVAFDARKKHATQEWEGTRWCLACFTTRSFKDLDRGDEELLLGMSFPVRGRTQAKAKKEEARPNKGLRKKLWRSARRLATLATWSVSSLEYPLPRGPDAVALFEIGDHSRTFETAETTFLTAEPCLPRDLFAAGFIVSLQDTLRELKPGTVWIHGDKIPGKLSSLTEFVNQQLATGGQVVLEADKDDDVVWGQEFIVEVMKVYESQARDGGDGRRLLRVGSSLARLPKLEESHAENLLKIHLDRKFTAEDGGGALDEDRPLVEMCCAVDHEAPRGHPDGDERVGSKGITFGPGPTIQPEVSSSLKRLHQNLGHIGAEDLCRHLRLAGAGPEVVKAAKRLRCEVRARNKRGGTTRPASAPKLLQFNQVVAVDAFSAYDAFGKRHEFMSVVDVGTSYHVVFSLRGHHAEDMELNFCEAWSHVFGPPGTIALDRRWHGPATVIGTEGCNLWVSFGGRCHLVAPEHLRRATGEELGEAFTSRATLDDLHKLLEVEPDEVIFADQDEEIEGDPVLLPGDGDVEEGPVGEERGVRRGPDDRGDEVVPTVSKRYRTKGPPEVPVRDPDIDDTEEVMMVRRAKTARGREKQLEKEIPWGMIPHEQHEAFRAAEDKQYREHIDHEALEPLSLEESRRINMEKKDRILNSRFAYRDKALAKRRRDPDVPWKHKARLVISGHLDPDINKGLETMAPTVSRQSILLLLQILASRLSDGWTAAAGDITAAFLNGDELPRELYFRQPRSGLGNLHPEQLLRIRKGVFGLVDSPHAWWNRFKGEVTNMKPELPDGSRCVIVQNPLDPCVFFVKKVLGEKEDGELELSEPICYLAVHVDDVILIGDKMVVEALKKEMSKVFPIEDWEEGVFEYIGSVIEVSDNKVKVSQEDYVASRLFEVEVHRGQADDDLATEEQLCDNRSLVGGLSWLAGQTRPDLQASVSMCQQLQKEPRVSDIKFTNLVARRAMEHKHRGIEFHPIDLNQAVLLSYHDAGWANAPPDSDDPVYRLTPEEDTLGMFSEGPFMNKPRRAKRGNSNIASQLGNIYILADRKILHGEPSMLSVLDWRSGACSRVCRSTFSAETMACCGAVEGADFIEKSLETLLKGELQRKTSGRITMRFLSDCRSLYDHLTRGGIPRMPSDRRLAIDMAAVRQDLQLLKGRLAWVPTGHQLADVLTKPMKARGWWEVITSPFSLTFQEGRRESF